MNKNFTYLFISCSLFSFSQQKNYSDPNSIIINPEILVGITAEANSDFPDRKMQKQFILNLAWYQTTNQQEWAKRLKIQRTGFSIGYTDFGNKNKLGNAISILPFLEFNAFKKKNLKVHLGIGASYFNKKYDSIYNPYNKAVSTDIVWSFKAFTYYEFFKDWRIGAGYFHHSNGHLRLPNQGFNSFLLSLSTNINTKHKSNKLPNETPLKSLLKSRSNYFTFSTGYGINVLSKAFNNMNPVYTLSGEYGKIYNNTFKLGIGFYYRFYQNYYDYIINNESLVQDGREFDSFKKTPTWNASNIGLTLNGEILMNHIGIDLQLGFNLHKPGYKIDWKINQGWDYVPKTIPENSAIVLGDFGFYYKLKQLISSRLGLKYYFIGNQKKTKSNVYLGTFINANLGQADFAELGFGYIYHYN
ncbi:hypothetical protein A8C32_16950 [Flavivirga aquatica]|uniref:Deacylase n=1 Tax=Flavivirga aquatica TaxID=1849968 RepID=A0A1E5T8N2_9FLAO|nr:acyloxyacyl hydrolase [Flavivirga aquatica]OEK07667.1 hypothetical protein A8C32_16950 [Flavivirga aquatica]